jgi:hypothetical protein
MPLRVPGCRVVDATMQERWKGEKWRKCVAQVEKRKSGRFN